MSYIWGLDVPFHRKEIIQTNSSKMGFIVRMPSPRNPWKTNQPRAGAPGHRHNLVTLRVLLFSCPMTKPTIGVSLPNSQEKSVSVPVYI